MVRGFTGKHFYLSNAYRVDIPFVLADGSHVVARSVEHAYQASKTLDVTRQRQILDAPSARSAVRMGRSADTVVKPDWDNLRHDTMRQLIQAKFADPYLRRRLMNERSNLYNIDPQDAFWGCTFDTEGVQHGQNMLGLTLKEYVEVAPMEGWYDEDDGQELLYQIVVIESKEPAGFQAFWGYVDYANPYGFGRTALEAITDLVVGEAAHRGEDWTNAFFELKEC